jgi:hypothetical protein
MEYIMKSLFVPVSQNAKTGPIPASITERGSCWSGCALYDKGCYAFSGALGHFWKGVSDGTRGGSWDELCAKVAKLPRRSLWRYAQAGDLPGSDDAIDEALLSQLIIANRGKRVIAFTHKPVLPDTAVAACNKRIIAAANTAGFTINLSANNAAEADALADLKIGPVATILAHDHARRMGGDDRPMARPHRPAADKDTGRTPHRDLPGDLHRRHLQVVWRLRRAPRGRDRLPGARCLAHGREGHRRARRPGRPELGLP